MVTDLTGKYVTTLDSGDGVDGLALSPDGGTLYAALSSQDSVAAIQVSSITATTTTPTQTLYPLAAGDAPYSVALQGGKAWVSYQPNSTSGAAGVAQIGDIDLAAATPATAFEPDTAALPSGTIWYSPPDLAADPSDTGTLVAVMPDGSGGTAATYDTTTDPATALAPPGDLGAGSATAGCGIEYQIAVIPGAKKFIAACAGSSVHEVYSVTNVATPTGSYPTAATPFGVAVDSAGDVAAGISYSEYGVSSGPPAVYIFSPSGTLLNKISLGAPLPQYSLAWAPDGSALYVVLQGASAGATLLARRDPRSPDHPGDGHAERAGVGWRHQEHRADRQGRPLGRHPAAAGTPVTITRALGTATAHFTVDTKTNGTFALTDTTAGNVGARTSTPLAMRGPRPRLRRLPLVRSRSSSWPRGCRFLSARRRSTTGPPPSSPPTWRRFTPTAPSGSTRNWPSTASS